MTGNRTDSAGTTAQVLVVDCNPLFLALMEELLRDEGMGVTTTLDGPTAGRLAADLRPDLILLDVHLAHPGEGMALLRDLISDPRTQRIPMLICSADARRLERYANDLNIAGIARIAKPFDITDLVTTIRSLLPSGAPTGAVGHST